MKKISIVGVLVEGANWVLHPIRNYKELKEYREDYEKEVFSFQEQLKGLKSLVNFQEKKCEALREKHGKTKNKMIEIENKLHEYTSAFPGDLHDYLDMQVKLEEWEKQGTLKDQEIRNMKATIRSLEQKVIYRNRVIDDLKSKKQKMMQEIIDLEKERGDAVMKCLELAKKVDFYEKQTKKSPKEKVDYLIKRGKKNE